MSNARSFTLLVALALASPALAGCIGGDDTGDDPPPTPATVVGKTRPEGQQEGLGWIFGTVVDAVTNASLANVNVSLAQGLGSATTDASGQYLILNVPRGEYVLNAKAPSDYFLSRYAVSVFADEGAEMHFKLQPESAGGTTNVTPVVFTTYWFKETSGADYSFATPGAMSNTEAPDGAPVENGFGHPQMGGYGATTLPDGVANGRDAMRMVWEVEMKDALTVHADTEAPVEFADPSYPGGDVSLVRYSAMTVKMWKITAAGGSGGGIVYVEDVAPDGRKELLALRDQDANATEGGPYLVDVPLPFLKRGKEFHTFEPGHKLRITFESNLAGHLAYFFDGADYPAGIDLRKGPYLEPPKAGDRIVIQVDGHTAAGASNPYGIAWYVPVPPEADPVLAPTGVKRTGAGGYYVGTACPDPKADTCVGDTTVFFEVPKGAQTVYTRLEFTAPPVRDPGGLMNDYDILLYEPSGKAHTHTAGYGGNQAELQFHDVFETPEWPQQWWVEIFAFLVVDADWTCTIEITF